MASVLSDPRFYSEEAAYAWVEGQLWPNGPVCPHCKGQEWIGMLADKSTRIGVYKCYRCPKLFRLTAGTAFEASHIPLHIWLQDRLLVQLGSQTAHE